MVTEDREEGRKEKMVWRSRVRRSSLSTASLYLECMWRIAPEGERVPIVDRDRSVEGKRISMSVLTSFSGTGYGLASLDLHNTHVCSFNNKQKNDKRSRATTSDRVTDT